MKKLVTVLLSVCLLFGCSAETAWTPTYPDNPQPAVSPLSKEEWSSMAYLWGEFYWDVRKGQASSIVNDAGSEIVFDGEQFHIEIDSVKYSYKHFVNASYRGEKTYTVCFILSNDPQMTAKQCTGPEQGVVIFDKTPNLDLIPSEGEIPQDILWLYQLQSESTLVYGKNCVFEEISADDSWSVVRYDYNGNVKSKTQNISHNGTLTPLDDGGFLWWIGYYPDRYYALQCYGTDGAQKWEHIFDKEHIYWFSDCIEYCDVYYLFGTIKEENSGTDVYCCAFAKDGTLLKETRIGGSDFDEIGYVEPQEDGFLILGRSQSRDGDFPLSPDGYYRAFVGTMNTSLELEIITVSNEYSFVHSSREGYYGGKPAYSVYLSDEKLFDHTFPYPQEVIDGDRVFDYKDGYVLVSYRPLEYSSVLQASRHINIEIDYAQLIFTFCDKSGNVRGRLAEAVVN